MLACKKFLSMTTRSCWLFPSVLIILNLQLQQEDMCVIARMSLATADMTKACMNDYETSAPWICGPKVYCHFEIQVALLIYPY